MEHHIFHHLGRDWEAVVLASAGDTAAVRFRHVEDDDRRTYEGEVSREELEEDGQDPELALRRALESSLVLRALSRAEALTAEEVAERAGMPVEATVDRLRKLDKVEPVLDPLGPRRYRVSGGG